MDRVIGRSFWRREAQLELECSACGRVRPYALIVGFDWRDHLALEAAEHTCPGVACSICGHVIANPCPLVQTRPGDPLQILVALPEGRPVRTDVLEGLLGELADGDVIVGPISALPVGVARELFARYTGFELCRLDGHDDASSGRWLDELRKETGADEIVATLLAFVSANDPAAAYRAVEANLEVLDDRWAPALRRLRRRLTPEMDTKADRSTLANRLRRFDQLVLLGALPADQAGLPAEVQEAIDSAIAVEADDETGLRTRRLEAALNELREHRDAEPLLYVGALNSLLGSLIALPSRTRSDLDRAVALADELLEIAGATLGAGHRLVRRARNDRAVARLALPVEERPQPGPIVELRELVDDCIVAGDPLLVDAALNLAVAVAEQTATPTADEQRETIELMRSALHVSRLIDPDDRANEVRMLNNLGAALRRLPAAPDGARHREAAAAYAEAQRLDDAHRVLTTAGRLQLDVNLLAARVDAAAGELDQLVSDLRGVYRRVADGFAAGHEVRLESTATLAALAVDLYDRSNGAGGPDVTLLDDACAWVKGALRAAAGWRELTIRMTNTLAVANSRPTPSGVRDPDAARAAFERILELTDPAADAGLRRSTARNLAQLHLGQGRWLEAATAYEVADSAASVMIDRASTVAGRLSEIEAASDLALLRALCLQHESQVAEAIDAIEGARQRLTYGEDPSTDLSPVVGDPDCVTAWMFTCSLGSGLIAMSQGSVGIATLDPVNSRRLSPVLDALDRAQDHSAVDRALADLEGALAPLLAPLHDLVAEQSSRGLLLIAAGSLARVPLHVLTTQQRGRPALERTVRFLPSARAAARLRARPARSGTTVVLHDPSAELAGAEAETRVVLEHVPAAVTPEPKESVRAFVVDALPDAKHVHIACHARVGKTAWASELLLGDPRPLTVADLLELDLDNLDSAIAAACRTAVPTGRAPDELLGVGYGLIAAGAAEVICCLWDIDDSVTALLVAEIYERRRTRPLAVALAEAQQWCAAMTISDLRALLDDPPAWMPDRIAGDLDARLGHPRYQQPDLCPFAAPSYWGGLIYIGR